VVPDDEYQLVMLDDGLLLFIQCSAAVHGAHVLPETHNQSSVGRLRYWLHRDYRLHVAYDDYPYEANWSFFLTLLLLPHLAIAK
jgi:hypothetical protein